jgi:hypothetical protein
VLAPSSPSDVDHPDAQPSILFPAHQGPQTILLHCSQRTGRDNTNRMHVCTFLLTLCHRAVTTRQTMGVRPHFEQVTSLVNQGQLYAPGRHPSENANANPVVVVVVVVNQSSDFPLCCSPRSTGHGCSFRIYCQSMRVLDPKQQDFHSWCECSLPSNLNPLKADP